MSADDNLATVQKLYEAFGRGDVATILDNLTDDVDWAADVENATAPWHGQRHGKDEVTGFFEGIASAAEVQEFTPLAFATSENEVMAFIRYRVRAKESGREAAMNLHHYWRFRDGKVEYYRGSEDSAQTAELLA